MKKMEKKYWFYLLFLFSPVLISSQSWFQQIPESFNYLYSLIKEYNFQEWTRLFPFFFTLTFLALIPSLGKKDGRLFYGLSLVSYVLWNLSILIPQNYILTDNQAYIWSLGTPIFYWLALIMFYSFFSRNFQRSWLPALGIPFAVLGTILTAMILLPLIYQLMPMVFIRKILDGIELPYGNLMAALFMLSLLIRLVIALVREEAFRLWAGFSFFLAMAIALWVSYSAESLTSPMESSFMTFILVPLLFMALMRLLVPKAQPPREKEEPRSERLLLELQESKKEMERLQQDLANEDTMMGRVLEKTRRLRESLLPQEIHPDKYWEAALFYQPENPDQRDYYDFFYSYGRKLRGAAFFDIQNGMNGSFTGSYLKGVLPDGFNQAGSLSSLYRNLFDGTEPLREGKELIGQLVRLNQMELEYCGWENAPILFRNKERKKAAPLLQDKPLNWENMKSYRIKAEPGDCVLLTNDPFYYLPHPVTDEPFGTSRASEFLGDQKGRATEILKNLVQYRQQYYGDRRFNRGVFMVILKRKELERE